MEKFLAPVIPSLMFTPYLLGKPSPPFFLGRMWPRGIRFECELLCDPGVLGIDGFMRHGRRKVSILLPRGLCLG